MAAEIIPLVELFGEIPDFRQASGKRYTLAAILALACAAMLCGYRSYSAMAEWGRNYGQELVTALGFPNGKTPCASMLHWIFRHLDCAQFENQLGQWAEKVLASQPPTSEQVEGIAIDGKTLRGSQKQGAPGRICSQPSAIAWASLWRNKPSLTKARVVPHRGCAGDVGAQRPHRDHGCVAYPALRRANHLEATVTTSCWSKATSRTCQRIFSSSSKNATWSPRR